MWMTRWKFRLLLSSCALILSNILEPSCYVSFFYTAFILRSQHSLLTSLCIINTLFAIRDSSHQLWCTSKDEELKEFLESCIWINTLSPSNRFIDSWIHFQTKNILKSFISSQYKSTSSSSESSLKSFLNLSTASIIFEFRDLYVDFFMSSSDVNLISSKLYKLSSHWGRVNLVWCKSAEVYVKLWRWLDDISTYHGMCLSRMMLSCHLHILKFLVS